MDREIDKDLGPLMDMHGHAHMHWGKATSLETPKLSTADRQKLVTLPELKCCSNEQRICCRAGHKECKRDECIVAKEFLVGLLTWCLSYCAEPLQAWAFVVGTALESCHIKVPATDASYIGFLHHQNKLMLALLIQDNNCEDCSFLLPGGNAVWGKQEHTVRLGPCRTPPCALCRPTSPSMPWVKGKVLEW